MSNAKMADRLPEELPSDPMHWADAWLKEATAAKVQRNPNSMTVASVGANSQPSSRVLLCKDFVPDPGYLVFYTNYRSKKSLELGCQSERRRVISLGRAGAADSYRGYGRALARRGK